MAGFADHRLVLRSSPNSLSGDMNRGSRTHAPHMNVKTAYPVQLNTPAQVLRSGSVRYTSPASIVCHVLTRRDNRVRQGRPGQVVGIKDTTSNSIFKNDCFVCSKATKGTE